MGKRIKKRPLFIKIFFPLMLLVITLNFILVITMIGQGIVGQLKDNEINSLEGKVQSRKTYLESEIINNWMELDEVSEEISQILENSLLDPNNSFSLEGLNQNSNSNSQVLLEIAPLLIEVMRENRVNGAYLIFNTEDLGYLNEESKLNSKPGLYFKDQDSTGKYSDTNDDISVKVAPLHVFKQLGITQDSDYYNTIFSFTDEGEKFIDAFYKPYQKAYEDFNKQTKIAGKKIDINVSDYGYLNIHPTAEEYQDPLLTYSMPLIVTLNSKQYLIGVMGIEVSFTHLRNILPYEELGEKECNYYLAQYNENTEKFSNVFRSNIDNSLIKLGDNLYTGNDDYHYSLIPLNIYYSNTPFVDEQWYIVGCVSILNLEATSNSFIASLILAILLTLVIGGIMAIAITYILQKPIAKLASEVKSSEATMKFNLSPSGITEVDKLVDEITNLSKSLLENGKMFSKIIEMASVKISGFQIDKIKRTIFLTENFFTVFKMDIDTEKLTTIESFHQIMDQFKEYFIQEESHENVYILKIPLEQSYQYIRINVLDTDEACYGLVEDVSKDMLEKQVMQYERDHDLLTNILNRRAFRRKMQETLDPQNAKIEVGALVMIDLDNLKYINDTYGHDYGDKYIKEASLAIGSVLKENDIYGRISGDEFNVFLHDYKSKEEIIERIDSIQKAVNSTYIKLANGNMHPIHATSGVSWFPNDSISIDDLTKYADYAMYLAKKNNKQMYNMFNIEIYKNQDVQIKNREILTSIIANKLIYFVFQPIVDVKNGNIYAYEALMRPDVEEKFYISDLLDTAREEGKLNQIEVLCWEKSLAAFVELQTNNIISQDCCIFINTIPNQLLSSEIEQELVSKYREMGTKIVLELTEDEQLDYDIWQYKQQAHRALGGRVALDDYGSGYNSEKNLLLISPEFIKVDIEIVRDIHINIDKRSIMEYIINFAHKRGKFIIAEGVEKEEEVKVLMELGVDYMQGYYFAKPEKVPSGINELALQSIRRFRSKKRGK